MTILMVNMYLSQAAHHFSHLMVHLINSSLEFLAQEFLSSCRYNHYLGSIPTREPYLSSNPNSFRPGSFLPLILVKFPQVFWETILDIGNIEEQEAK